MLDDFLRPDAGTLDKLVRDLTAEARAGRLEPVCCRDAEISRVIDILLRQSKNNPALVGPAGVGKTAIAEGLAQRVAAGAVPLTLRNARVLALDHVALLAGTMYRGQYEERLKMVVQQASADPNILLFIDELHNLIGQGTAMGAAMDAANMLKPALVRGDFRVIGATTREEYDRWVRADPALERRFQQVAIHELSAEQTLEVLRARKDGLERHHNVAISDDAIAAAVHLTDLLIKDRARPDRAIDALDEACAHTQARAHYTPEIEALIVERKELLREGAHVAAQQGAEAGAGSPRAEGAPGGESREEDPMRDDPIERFARDSFAALERFGAELEAVFVGQPARAEPEPGAAAGERPRAAPPRAAAPSARLAAVEWELHRRLIEEGLVVRGHDVARVVTVATGQRVEWQP